MPRLSQRELMMLQDNISNEQVLINKFGFYAQQVRDPELKQVFQNIQRTHQQHYDILSRQLQAGLQ
ncbi:MAG TPA: ferritin-like domain-containing protein [Firmicutes bacterium]|nr:ferritin-like domain-containing protein [Bacillota bacterium]